MKKLFCPNCGKQNVQSGDDSPYGGSLYVAEELEGSTEFYDDAHPHECLDCGTHFYLGTN